MSRRYLSEEQRDRRYAALREARSRYGVPLKVLADLMVLDAKYVQKLCSLAGTGKGPDEGWQPTQLQLAVKALRERQPPLSYGQIGARLGVHRANAFHSAETLRQHGIEVP